MHGKLTLTGRILIAGLALVAAVFIAAGIGASAQIVDDPGPFETIKRLGIEAGIWTEDPSPTQDAYVVVPETDYKVWGECCQTDDPDVCIDEMDAMCRNANQCGAVEDSYMAVFQGGAAVRSVKCSCGSRGTAFIMCESPLELPERWDEGFPAPELWGVPL